MSSSACNTIVAEVRKALSTQDKYTARVREVGSRKAMREASQVLQEEDGITLQLTESCDDVLVCEATKNPAGGNTTDDDTDGEDTGEGIKLEISDEDDVIEFDAVVAPDVAPMEGIEAGGEQEMTETEHVGEQAVKGSEPNADATPSTNETKRSSKRNRKRDTILQWYRSDLKEHGIATRYSSSSMARVAQDDAVRILELEGYNVAPYTKKNGDSGYIVSSKSTEKNNEMFGRPFSSDDRSSMLNVIGNLFYKKRANIRGGQLL